MIKSAGNFTIQFSPGNSAGPGSGGLHNTSVFSLPRASEEGEGVSMRTRELVDTEYIQYSLVVSKRRSQHRPAEDPKCLFTTSFKDCSAKPHTRTVAGRAVLPLKHDRYNLCNCL